MTVDAGVAAASDGRLRVGIRPPHGFFEHGAPSLLAAAALIRSAGLDHVTVGDHVSFHGGAGSDGLIQSTALAVAAPELEVHTGVYLLPLRHPVLVARQIATLAQLAPGRFVFGCGIGGEDRAEVAACGVDPATRGRRMDEALPIVRALLAGESVTSSGEFFPLQQVSIAPAAAPAVPIIIGGRSDHALRRAGRFADGWLGTWVSPSRYASALELVQTAADAAVRGKVTWRHGLHVWCGFAASRERATALVSAELERFYGLPFAKFDRYIPRGSPQDVAEALRPYLAAGCHDIHLLPVADDDAEAVASCGAVRALLLAECGQTDPGDSWCTEGREHG
jgi:alkanesulfonate monooxygenase SsuD/methylene tetrahydromethanopterin reductase-like flavin-dependent oxidoreductase (luciferase family)